MGYAILRTQKLKDKGSIQRSLKHAFREQETPNADPQRTPTNTHIGAQSTAEAVQAINGILPDKVRKNGVLAIEYLITGSPEDINGKTREAQDQYFSDALEWLKERHGAGHVAYAGIHRDETTPHMYAYVVPIDSKGKLNCRAFLGGSKALNEMQTEFAEKVGKRHQLKRGIEGSKAKHQRVSQFYGQINQAPTPVNTPTERKVIKKGFFTTRVESDADFANRVAESVKEEMKPIVEKASISAQIERKNEGLQRHNSLLKKSVEALKRPFKGITKEQSAEIIKKAQEYRVENEKAEAEKQNQEREAAEREKQELIERQKQRRARSRSEGMSR